MNFGKDNARGAGKVRCGLTAQDRAFKLAAPSWVFPGTVAENCRFLCGKVDEAGLLFMEAASALAYTKDDLPLELAGLPLEWHVHLPSDLDWQDAAEAAKICLKLMEKIDYLGARRAVLHPPCVAEPDEKKRMEALENFVLYWRSSGRHGTDLLLENLPPSDLNFLLEASEALDISLCLDLAHLLIGGQELPVGYMNRARLLHLCAPAPDGGKGHHHPLTALTPEGMETGRRICRGAGPETVFMLELFNWKDILASLPVLRSWME